MQLQKNISTFADKTAALEGRKQAERNLVSQVERALRIVEDDSDVGCNFCFLFRKLRNSRSSIGSLHTVSATGAAPEVGKAASNSSAHRALFGSKKKKTDPNSKLQEVWIVKSNRLRFFG